MSKITLPTVTINDIVNVISDACSEANVYKRNHFRLIHKLLGDRDDVNALDILDMKITDNHKVWIIQRLSSKLNPFNSSRCIPDSVEKIKDIFNKILNGGFVKPLDGEIWDVNSDIILINKCSSGEHIELIGDSRVLHQLRYLDEEYIMYNGKRLRELPDKIPAFKFTKKSFKKVPLYTVTIEDIVRALDDACEEGDRYRNNDYRLVKRMFGNKKKINALHVLDLKIPLDHKAYILDNTNILPYPIDEVFTEMGELNSYNQKKLKNLLYNFSGPYESGDIFVDDKKNQYVLMSDDVYLNTKTMKADVMFGLQRIGTSTMAQGRKFVNDILKS